MWDRALLLRFREGEPAAMGEVYRLHAGPLSRMLRAAAYRGASFAALRSAVELENTLVEVFARAFEPRARQAYDGVRPYEQYLMGIARNVLLEQARHREQAAGLELEAEVDRWLLADAADVTEVLEDREVDSLLRAFRAGLSADEGKLFDARYVEGLAQEAAAARLGQTRIQLRRREQKLRARLLEYLQGHGYLGQLAASGWSFVKEGT